MKGNYKFVGFPVVIDSIYNYVHTQCADYVYNGLMDDAIVIKTTQDDIENERKRTNEYDIIKQSTGDILDDGQLESLAIYRKFCDIIYENDCILMHGCAVSAYGKAYLFLADSGVGKSTHAKLWLYKFGNRAEIINGNNPVIKIENGCVNVYGTPWCGKEGLNKNVCIPLQAICILNRDRQNHIEEISENDAYAEILRQCYDSSYKNSLINIRSTLRRVFKSVHLYSLGCNMEASAAIVAYEGMKNKTQKKII